MKISYAITVCNELVEIQRLISHLLKHKRKKDEIVVVYDSINGSREVEEFLRSHSINGEFRWYPYSFDNNFADLKNYLTALCNKDYIFQIDADEIPHEALMENLPEILSSNNIEVILVPRVNTVSSIGLSHMKKWNWKISTPTSIIEEKIFDLDDPRDRDEYNLLKEYNLIIEEYS
jgi:hypothetical protein